MKHSHSSFQDRETLVASVARLAGTKAAKDIANELGLSYSTLKGIAQANGISLRCNPVDDHDKFLIRELKRQYNIPYRIIGEKFEISIGMVRNICIANASITA